MLQEEMNNKTVALMTNSSKMTTRVLLKMIDAFLKYQKNKGQDVKHGKQSIKNLAKQGKSITNIEITNKNIKSFEKYARKYNVDYALKKIHYKDDDGFDKFKHVVFFKAQDNDSIKLAFMEYSKDMLERANSKSMPILDILENYRDRLEEKIEEPKVQEVSNERVENLKIEEPKVQEVSNEKVKPLKIEEPKVQEVSNERVENLKIEEPKVQEASNEKVQPLKMEEPKMQQTFNEELELEQLLSMYEEEPIEEIAELMASYNHLDFEDYNPYEDIQQNYFNDFGDVPMSVSDEDYMDIPFDYNGNEFFEDSSTTQENFKENISNSNVDKKLAKNKNKSIKEQQEISIKDKSSKTKIKTQETKKSRPKSRGDER